ncbi:MAG: serine protease [Solirubrobacterales bacterium]|nr:serine protease [Solirubrobacterales bacterium]
MVGIAQKAGVRTVSFGCGLVVLALALGFGTPTAPAAQHGASAGIADGGGQAVASVVNGTATSIGKWPWQVALLGGRRPGTRATPLARFFCGGSLIAPDLVLTAAHCVANVKKSGFRNIQVVSGRTRLNRRSTGTVSAIKRAIFPLNRNGKRRYRATDGVPSWDLALLQLKAPLSSATIRIAGPDEAGATKPGRPTFTAGWGVTGPLKRKSSNRLRMARQVMLPNRICRSTTGRFFDGTTMNCLGGPGAHSSTCFGDSGGPLVTAVGDEFRLVGLTSNGDPYCRPYIPSVDTRIAAGPIRGWIHETALAISGIDVIGRGGSVGPLPRWCRVPRLRNLTLPGARRLLRSRSCRLGRTRPDRFSGLRRGRISFSGFLPGWFAPPNARITVWVAR